MQDSQAAGGVGPLQSVYPQTGWKLTPGIICTSVPIYRITGVKIFVIPAILVSSWFLWLLLALQVKVGKLRVRVRVRVRVKR